MLGKAMKKQWKITFRVYGDQNIPNGISGRFWFNI